MKIVYSISLILVTLAAVNASPISGRNLEFAHKEPTVVPLKRNVDYKRNFQDLADKTTRRYSRRGVETTPLADFDQEFFVEAYIGTSKQYFRLLPDTGSADTWVPGINCTEGGCASSRNRFSPAESATSEEQNGNFSIAYGDGTNVSCLAYKDTVAIGNAIADGQAIGVATFIASNLGIQEYDGILGLSFLAIAASKTSPFMDTLFANGVVPDEVFSIAMPPTGAGELALGGINPKWYNDPLLDVPLTGQNLWQVQVQDIAWGDETLTSGYDTLIDSGTSMITVSNETAKALHSKIDHARPYEEDSIFWVIPCNTQETFRFQIGDSWYTIPHSVKHAGAVAQGSSECVSSVTGGAPTDCWILGKPFFAGYYSVFDKTNARIQFAPLVEKKADVSP
ncbi:Type I transmembrane sorting receptor [Mortierella polycephala]|uniref:Type I transmembrane sorting receptor n=1 Tax=Mortierella polycephala TaxID=41804 RepID=A0A9P6Q487_9FUNG|nr:Type I transmembrane sorting receptor [Mortierella polycephala]